MRNQLTKVELEDTHKQVLTSKLDEIDDFLVKIIAEAQILNDEAVKRSPEEKTQNLALNHTLISQSDVSSEGCSHSHEADIFLAKVLSRNSSAK